MDHPLARRVAQGHKIFGAQQHEGVGLDRIDVARQLPAGLAGDRGRAQRPVNRFNPGWLLAHEENGDLAAKLIRETCERQGIDPATLTLHADRGPVPKGKTVKQLLIDLDVTSSFSRPRISNDNPFSEAEFRTMKYGPDYPSRFDNFEHARGFCRKFFPRYNNDHRHSGLAYFTPADVHYGRIADVLAQRQTVMDQAFARTPDRFPNGPPRVPAPPRAVWINPPENRAEIELGLQDPPL